MTGITVARRCLLPALCVLGGPAPGGPARCSARRMALSYEPVIDATDTQVLVDAFAEQDDLLDRHSNDRAREQQRLAEELELPEAVAA